MDYFTLLYGLNIGTFRRVQYRVVEINARRPNIKYLLDFLKMSCLIESHEPVNDIMLFFQLLSRYAAGCCFSRFENFHVGFVKKILNFENIKYLQDI